MSLLSNQDSRGQPTILDITRKRNQAPPPPVTTVPLWRLGFRPFYLLAAAFAGVAVPLWLATFFGYLPASGASLAWHVHEMVFGFAVAVIIGFLFTAASNWTGLPTPRGRHLAALAALWLAGRVAMLLAPPGVAALVDLAFLPLAAWPLYQVLQRAANKRNLFLVGLLALLAALNASFHGAVLGWWPLDPIHPLESAILVLVIIEAVMGGRVIPMFTANTLGSVQPVVNPRRDRLTVALLAATALAWTFGVPAPATAALCIAASMAVLLRVLGFMPHRTLRHPLLWILHLSYAWLSIGLFLLGLAALGLVSDSAGFHALGIGATAGLVIGMLTRTALGHTGRPLQAGRAETVMYLALHAGAVLRVLASLQVTDSIVALLVASAACWSTAFILYLVVYGPYLVRPRLDGKDG
jgi:uncharacterized protein involved in response to NO